MVTFEQFFDSDAKVRLAKLFIYNTESVFGVQDIVKRLDMNPSEVRKGLESFTEQGFLKSKTAKSLKTYTVDKRCDFFNELRSLIFKFAAASQDKILKDVKKIGVIKLMVLAGVFLNTDKSRVDIFIVGEKIKEGKFQKFLKNLESEVGKELTYSILTAAEFKYRQDMFDRFVRDILEFPHEKIINKLKI